MRELEVLSRSAAKAQNAGDYAEAEKHHRALLDKMSHVLNFPASERARQMSNLASVLNLRGAPAEAEKLLLDAQIILNDHPSDDPVQYAVLYGNLAMSQKQQARFAEAEKNYSRALEILGKQAGQDVHVASCKAGLASIWAQTGRRSEALRYYQESLSVFRKFGGASHPVVKRIEAEYENLKVRTK